MAGWLVRVVALVALLVVWRVAARISVKGADFTSPCSERHDYIVKFSRYAPLPELEAAVRTTLLHELDLSDDSFSFPPGRHVHGPTDFVLVSACPDLHSSLRLVDGVLSVHRQRRYVRSEPLEANAAQATTLSQHCYSAADEPGVRALWAENATGAGIRIAVFDTGMDERALKRFRRIALRVDYTHETGVDALGHGTLVAGVVAASPSNTNDNSNNNGNNNNDNNSDNKSTIEDDLEDGGCAGVAPDAELYIFRVFTSAKVSYTTWFLDAFNHAMHLGVHIINLSIGGPDFEDQPFVDKVRELSANNVIVVSAVGNDGPHWGTVNNPADQLDVLAVGGLARAGDVLAPFSSRGMTTWELPRGYGRAKPDLIAPAQDVCAPSFTSESENDNSDAMIMVGNGNGNNNPQKNSDPSVRPIKELNKGASTCRPMSGTSAAAPLVSGAIALLASAIPEGPERRAFLTPPRVKLLLTTSARRIPRLSVFEQGAGALDLVAAFARLKERATNPLPDLAALPSSLDLTPTGCSYTWPWCAQPLYARAQPLYLNVTLVNARALASTWTRPPRFEPEGSASVDVLDVRVSYSARLWPYSGWVALAIRVKRNDYVGVARGHLVINIGDDTSAASELRVPIRIPIIATPPRSQRLLWDQFHQLRFPSGYFPRDSLRVVRDPFDWLGDHPHTNFRELWDSVRSQGYFLEVLGSSVLCFDAHDYGALLIVDTEDEWDAGEIRKLRADVEERGLSLVVVADWYDRSLFPALRFFDENTRQWWTPLTGGANVPALNALLAPWGIAFGERVYDGKFSFGNSTTAAQRWAVFGSGVPIAEFPAGGRLVPAELVDFSAEMATGARETHKVPVLGFYAPEVRGLTESGRVSVFGDSTCLDAAGRSVQQTCLWLLKDMLRYATHASLPEAYAALPALPVPFKAKRYEAARHTDALASAFTRHSLALHASELRCDLEDLGAVGGTDPNLKDPANSDPNPRGEQHTMPVRAGVFRRGGTMRVARGMDGSLLGADALSGLSGASTLRGIVVVLAAASFVVIVVLVVLKWFRTKRS